MAEIIRRKRSRAFLSGTIDLAQEGAKLRLGSLIFRPAERSESLVQAGHGQANHIEVTAFDARNESAGVALDSIAAGLIVGFARRKIV